MSVQQPRKQRGKTRVETFDGDVKLEIFNGLPYVDKPYKNGKWILPLDPSKFSIGDRVRVTVTKLPPKARHG